MGHGRRKWQCPPRDRWEHLRSRAMTTPSHDPPESSSTAPADLVLLCAALLTAGWLAVSLRDARTQDRANRVLAEGTFVPSRAPELEAAYHRAKLLNPDIQPLIGEATVDFLTGRPQSATEALERAVRREPRIQAWNLLAVATRRLDPVRSAQVRRQVRALRPLSPPS